MFSSAEQYGEDLAQASIVHRKTPFLLKNGSWSHLFVDLREAHSTPRRLIATGRMILDATLNKWKYDTVGGTGVDGGAVVSGVLFAGLQLGIDLKGYATHDDRRKLTTEQDPKNGYGFRRTWVEDRKVLAVEGTLTSGGSLLTLVDLIRQAGGIVAGAAVVLDRSGGRLEEIGEMAQHPQTKASLPVCSLFTLDEEARLFVPVSQEPA